MTTAARDLKYMKRALELAKRGLGRTSPNPAVGAVVVAGDQIAGEGFHRAAGEPHAEIVALQQAGQQAVGAEMYVTLEPCSTYGRTPPCTDAIIAAGISRVIYACEDCDPSNAGLAAQILSAAGIETVAGVLDQEARQLNEAFFKHKNTGYPFVTVKLACTLDGKIATRSGDARWITGKEAREFVHILRDRSDALMVGRGTVAADDPALTTRTDRPDCRDAVRVVVDTRAQTPPTAQVLSVESDAPCLIAVAEPEVRGDEVQKRIAKLQQAGAEIVLVSEEEGRVDLRELLRQLGSRDIMSVLVEGGSRLVGGLLKEGLVDKLLFFYAPKILGDDQALSAISGMKVANISDARSVHIHRRYTGDCIPMFTGLIEQVGRVAVLSSAGNGLDLTVEAPTIGPECAVGDSIAVNGICLTVEQVTGSRLEFHVGTETVQRSTVAGWQTGRPVNLERALSTGQRMGGHFVQGHVDCVSELIKRGPPAETVYFTFALPAQWRPFIAEKGSIAVDGISLTVTEVTEEYFSVAIIPYTLEHTNLAQLSAGAQVNIEVDIIAKYVYNMLTRSDESPESTITKEFLTEHGFC